MTKSHVFGELVRAGSRLSDETRYTSQISILVEQAIDVSRSSVAALFAYSDPENPSALLRNVYQRGIMKFRIVSIVLVKVLPSLKNAARV